MRVTDFSLFLMVKRPIADLSRLSSKLGLSEVRVWKAGEPRTTPKGTPLSGPYQESYCGLSVPKCGGVGLSESISQALDHLCPNRQTLDELTATDGSVMIVVRWLNTGNSGEVFAPELLHRLANMNIRLGIDLYRENTPMIDGSQ